MRESHVWIFLEAKQTSFFFLFFFQLQNMQVDLSWFLPELQDLMLQYVGYYLECKTCFQFLCATDEEIFLIHAAGDVSKEEFCHGTPNPITLEDLCGAWCDQCFDSFDGLYVAWTIDKFMDQSQKRISVPHFSLWSIQQNIQKATNQSKMFKNLCG